MIINGLTTLNPFNGLTNGFFWGYFTPTSNWDPGPWVMRFFEIRLFQGGRAQLDSGRYRLV